MEEKKYTLDQIYGMANDFLKKYPFNISWRIKQHCKIIEKHLNPDEEIFYLFPAQKNISSFDISSTVIIVFTNKRILIGQKKILWGYNLLSITPDMFNDFEVYKGMIFGKIDIDTVKEVIKLSNIDPKALVEIETNMSEYLLRIKPNYVHEKNGTSE